MQIELRNDYYQSGSLFNLCVLRKLCFVVYLSQKGVNLRIVLKVKVFVKSVLHFSDRKIVWCLDNLRVRIDFYTSNQQGSTFQGLKISD